MVFALGCGADAAIKLAIIAAIPHQASRAVSRFVTQRAPLPLACGQTNAHRYVAALPHDPEGISFQVPVVGFKIDSERSRPQRVQSELPQKCLAFETRGGGSLDTD
ncbi:unnamed protein product [Phytophthora lilii]|uniref:Unnamed protein product n=1 Tax=Phytophthora lilii TaxID=2077276 RepID=A0A9W6TT48_9STRA|nr:unnamed protein product [Phytophthora lilii]